MDILLYVEGENLCGCFTSRGNLDLVVEHSMYAQIIGIPFQHHDLMIHHCSTFRLFLLDPADSLHSGHFKNTQDSFVFIFIITNAI
jgi:hypothetical protein